MSGKRKMSHNNLLSRFQSITNADAETSKFYLESSGWDLEKATMTFFESGGGTISGGGRGGGSTPPVDVPMKETSTQGQAVGIEFDAQKFGEQLQKSFVELVDNPTFADVVFLVQGEKIPAHRVIVSAWSSVLRDIMKNRGGGDREKGSDGSEIELDIPQEKGADIFKLLLRFMYLGCTGVTKEVVMPLLDLATRYEVHSLKDKCAEFLFVSDEKKDLGFLLDAAQKYDCKHLEKRCASHIAHKFDECLRSDALMNLGLSTWLELLQNDEIKVADEKEVFSAVIRYARKQGDKKDEVLITLLPLIRFPYMDNKFLIEEVEPHPDLKNIPLAHELIHEAFRYKLYKTDKDATTLRAKPRKGVMKWSSYKKSNALQLDSTATVAEHSGTQATAWLSVCADKWFSKGVQTFEVVVNNNTSNWLFIGVASRSWKAFSDQSSGYLGQNAESWSYGSYTGWGKTHNRKNEAYGAAYTTGDHVVATVDMDKKTLSFAVNGKDLGVCHTGLPDEVCPAITLYKKGDKVTLKGY